MSGALGGERALPSDVSALVSGGKDSVTTAHYLDSIGKLARVVFLDTGISIPGVEDHVRGLCERFGWPLEVYRAPRTYEWLVRKLGFPSVRTHTIAVRYLKGRGIQAFKKAHHGEWLASGVRRHESSRRRLTSLEFGRWEEVPIWAPIIDWTNDRVWAYVREHNLPLSPAYATLHLSGDCLCGAFARREECHLLRVFYPELAERIARLERETGKRWGGWSVGVADRPRTLESFVCSECELR